MILLLQVNIMDILRMKLLAQISFTPCGQSLNLNYVLLSRNAPHRPLRPITWLTLIHNGEKCIRLLVDAPRGKKVKKRRIRCRWRLVRDRRIIFIRCSLKGLSSTLTRVRRRSRKILLVILLVLGRTYVW